MNISIEDILRQVDKTGWVDVGGDALKEALRARGAFAKRYATRAVAETTFTDHDGIEHNTFVCKDPDDED
jgi:hypothetical protein